MTNERRLIYRSELELKTLRKAIEDAVQQAKKQPIDGEPDRILAELDDFSTDSVRLSYSGSGLTSETVELIVGLATAGPAYDIWRYIVLPRIIARFGDDALRRDPKESEPTDD